MKTNKGFIVPILIAILAILVAGAGVYMYSQSKKTPEAGNSINENQPENLPSNVSENNNATLQTPPATTNWKTYTNTRYGFEIKYPQDLVLDYGGATCEENSTPLSECGDLALIKPYNKDEKCSPALGIDVELVSKETAKMTPKEFINHWLPSIQLIEDENQTIAGQPAYTEVYKLMNAGVYTTLQLTKETALLYKNNFYLLEYKEGCNDGAQSVKDWKYVNLFDQILSTFKFVNNPESNTATQTIDTKTNSVQWKNLIGDIRPVLKKAFTDFNIELDKPISISEEADITGDGIPEALVSLGTSGATSESFTLMRIENNKPVMATLKEKGGKITTVPFFMIGAGGSGRYGSGVRMLGEKNAIYSASYSEYGKSNDSCEVSIYQWNPQTKIFEYNIGLSNPAQQEYCSSLLPESFQG